MVDYQHPSKDAKVTLNGVVVASLKGFEHGVEVAPIEDHDLTGGVPAYSGPGDRSFTWSAEIGWVDNSYAALVLAGTKFTLLVEPEGAGGKTVTYSNAYITKCRDKAGKLAVQLTSIEGRALSRLDG